MVDVADLLDYIKTNLMKTLAEQARLNERKSENSGGVFSGIKPLDEVLGGFQHGELTGVLSLPGAGAKDLAFQLAVCTALNGSRVRAFFPGTSAIDAGARALCILTKVTLAEAYSALAFDRGRILDLLSVIDVEISPSFPTVSNLEEASREADLLIIDGAGALSVPGEAHPSLFLSQLARSSATAIVVVDELRDTFRFSGLGPRYKDRLDSQASYDTTVMLDLSLSESEAKNDARPDFTEADLVIEDNVRGKICLGLRLKRSPAAPLFSEWSSDEDDTAVSRWYPIACKAGEASLRALKLREWEIEFDQMLLCRSSEMLNAIDNS